MKFMQIKPQKARGKFTESMWTDSFWSAENKFDGDRRIAQFCGDVVRLTGTRESVDFTGFVEKTANVPQITDWADKMAHRDAESARLRKAVIALEGTVLDGEIVAPWAAKLSGGESKWVTSIMGSSPERAIQIQKEKGWLEYMVFDCLWWKGKDIRGLPLHERRLHVISVLNEWKNPYAKAVMVNFTETRKRAEWGRAREGLVFKHASHTYGDEKLWVKRKKEFTADVICMGFEPGNGKYAGSVGAIVFGQYSKELDKKTPPHPFLKGPWIHRMGTCSGFTDAQRNRLSREPKKYLMRVMEIKHNGREPTGAFRHPRFAWKWRDDKNPKDCVYREDET